MHLSSQEAKRLQTRELAIFAMLGSLMLLSKFIMQMVPNIHLLGLFIASTTLTFRFKALIPLYIFIFLDGLLGGFALWWVPYLYIWLPLWCAFMILGKANLSKKIKTPIYMLASGLHGLLFGVLYAPLQALMFGLNFQGMITWIIAGLPFDVIHAIGNTATGILIEPLSALLKRLNNREIA